jgi:hypothetical protein
MKIYKGLNMQGSLVYFEVSNVLLSRRAASKLVSRIPGVSVTSWPKLFFGREDVFCKFTLDDKRFELWEPFGDNNRFHVAANPLEPCDALKQILGAFQEHRPIPGLTRLFLLVTGIALICYRLYYSH